MRPGTFEALRDQLEERGAGYYDLIHLDVHGSVNEYGMYDRPVIHSALGCIG